MSPWSRPLRTAALATVVSLGCAPVASAQFIANLVKNAGVSASVGIVHTPDSDVNVGPVYGFALTLAPRAGWDWAGSLGWFSADLLVNSGGSETNVGTVNVRPLMGGIGYTWVFGKLYTTAALTAGVSINSAELADEYRQIFGPGTNVSLNMDNSFAVRPGLEVEYMVRPKFSLTGYANYFYTKVDSELKTPAGNFTDVWNASSFQLFGGVTVYPFR